MVLAAEGGNRRVHGLHAALPVRHGEAEVLQGILHGGWPEERLLALATYDKDDAFDHTAAKGFIKLQTLSGKTWASNRRQEGAPAELFDAEKQQGPLKKGKYEDVTPLGQQVVAEAEAVLA